MKLYTARVTYGGFDRLDITRQHGKSGLFLAPSWEILNPVLEVRKRATTMLARANGIQDAERALAIRAEAEATEEAAWEAYVPRYRAEMRRSFVAHRADWDRLLAEEERTLVCFCAPRPGRPLQCHRVLAAQYLVAASGGAAYYLGER